MRVITVASDPNHPGCIKLQESLKRHGWEYEILVHPFRFGGQMQHIAEWCIGKAEWFLYTDAYDTMAFGDRAEVYNILRFGYKMFISAEKNCYPHVELKTQYPEVKNEWKYVNGGGFIAHTEFFTELYQTHNEGDNDQDWLARMYLSNQDKIKLDTNCEIFQTIAFEGAEDFEYNAGGEHTLHGNKVEPGFHPEGDSKVTSKGGRLRNKKTGTYPVFIHGNGHTDMTRIWKMHDETTAQ